MVAGLGAAGLEVGPNDAARRSSIVTLQRDDAETLASRLGERGVHVWGRAGVIRLSPYFYNDDNDIDRAVETLVDTWEEAS